MKDLLKAVLAQLFVYTSFIVLIYLMFVSIPRPW